MLRYHRPDDAATVDGEDGGDDGEARLQHQMVMMVMMVIMVMVIPTRIFLAGHAFIIWRFSYSKLQSSNRMEVTKEVLAKTK